MRHRTKCREDRLNRSRDMADFLGFWKFQIFNSWDAQEGRSESACQILSKLLKPRIFRFFKMAAVRQLGFSKVGNFNFRSQCVPSYQISRWLVERFQRYARFSIFSRWRRRHLGFWKFQIFNGWDAQEGRSASACQISSKSLKPQLRYGDSSIFQDGGRPPSWIGFTRVGTTHEEYLVVFVTVQNLVVIGAVISIVCKF